MVSTSVVVRQRNVFIDHNGSKRTHGSSSIMTISHFTQTSYIAIFRAGVSVVPVGFCPTGTYHNTSRPSVTLPSLDSPEENAPAVKSSASQTLSRSRSTPQASHPNNQDPILRHLCAQGRYAVPRTGSGRGIDCRTIRLQGHLGWVPRGHLGP